MGSGSMYELETITWRILFGRAIIFRAVRQCVAELYEMAIDIVNHPVIDRALDTLNDAVDTLAATSSSDAAFMSALVRECENRLTEIIHTRQLKKDEADLLGELYSLISQANATDPFRALLSAVSKFAADSYADFWRVPQLSLSKRMSHPRSGPPYDPYPLSAKTTVQREVVVQLSVCPPLFGPAAFAAIPFIFVHECVCHVPARQDRNRNSSPFAEGFMAWAAWYFFRRWVVPLDSKLAPAALQHGDDLHNILKGRTNPAFAPRRVGYRNADRLMAWFHQELGESLAEAEVRVASLAVELNLAEVELARKDNFVVRLRTVDRDQELGDRLRAWTEGLTAAAAVI